MKLQDCIAVHGARGSVAYRDLDDPEYRAIDRVSHSLLKEIDRSPAHLLEAIISKKEPTEQMKLGSAVHALVLTPGLDVVRAMPDLNLRTKEGRGERDRLEEEARASGLILLDDEEQLEAARAMAEAAREHPAVKRLLAKTTATEESILFRRGGLECKARLDALTHDGIVWDIKTCSDASAKEFGKAVVNRSYLTQAEIYLFAANEVYPQSFDNFVFVAVENTPPYGVAAYAVDTQSVYFEAAMRKNERRIKTYLGCLEAGLWPAYSSKIQDLIVPAWALNDVEVDDE